MFGLSAIAFVRGYILNVRTRYLTSGNLTKFTTSVQLGTKMKCLDFEFQRSKVKIMDNFFGRCIPVCNLVFTVVSHCLRIC